MDLTSYHRATSRDAITRSRGVKVVVPESSGVMSGTIASQLNRSATAAAAVDQTVPSVAPPGGNTVSRGAPPVRGGDIMADRTALMKLGGHVSETFDAAKTARSIRAQDVEGVGRPARSRTFITPATARLIDRFASANITMTEAQEIKKAADLLRRGFTSSKGLNVLAPPNYNSRVEALSNGTLTGFTPYEVSGAMPGQTSAAAAAYNASGYGVGKSRDPMQAALEASAARQPKSTKTGVLFPLQVQPGDTQAAGFAADETGPTTFGGLLTAEMDAVTNPYGTDRQEEAVRTAREAAATVAEAPAAETQPTGGVVAQVKPSEVAPTPVEEMTFLQYSDFVSQDPRPEDIDTAGDRDGVDPVKTVAAAAPATKKPPAAPRAPRRAPKAKPKAKPAPKAASMIANAEPIA